MEPFGIGCQHADSLAESPFRKDNQLYSCLIEHEEPSRDGWIRRLVNLRFSQVKARCRKIRTPGRLDASSSEPPKPTKERT